MLFSSITSIDFDINVLPTWQYKISACYSALLQALILILMFLSITKLESGSKNFCFSRIWHHRSRNHHKKQTKILRMSKLTKHVNMTWKCISIVKQFFILWPQGKTRSNPGLNYLEDTLSTLGRSPLGEQPLTFRGLTFNSAWVINITWSHSRTQTLLSFLTKNRRLW